MISEQKIYRHTIGHLVLADINYYRLLDTCEKPIGTMDGAMRYLYQYKRIHVSCIEIYSPGNKKGKKS